MNKQERLNIFKERFIDDGDVIDFTKDSAFYEIEFSDGRILNVPLYMGELE